MRLSLLCCGARVAAVALSSSLLILFQSTEASTTSNSGDSQEESPSTENDSSSLSEKPAEAEAEARRQISIVLKTPKEKQTVQIDDNAGVKDIKKLAAEKFNADPDYLCLIYAGKLMEDDDTLETRSIKDGMTINLVIKTAPIEPEAGSQRPPADITQTPFGFANIGGLPGLETIGMGSSTFMELQSRLQTELLSNPELLKKVLDNPLVQAMMKDGESMKKLIVCNPQMQDLMNRHPEIKSMLSNNDLLKQTADLAKNPSMLKELMKNVDGTEYSFSSLPSIYRDFQASQDQGAQSRKPSDTAAFFNNPQLTSLLQQMYEKPQMVQNMLTAPYTQAMLQAFASNPDMATALIKENPLYQGQPALQEYIGSMMPHMMAQLQNPEVLNALSNPQAVNALLHIQEGLDQLKSASPAFMNTVGFGTYTFPAAEEESEVPSQQSEEFTNFMASMVKNLAERNPNLPPEQRFKGQMEYLKNMGFMDEKRNLEKLTDSSGDVNIAVQKLLQDNLKNAAKQQQ